MSILCICLTKSEYNRTLKRVSKFYQMRHSYETFLLGWGFIYGEPGEGQARVPLITPVPSIREGTTVFHRELGTFEKKAWATSRDVKC